MYVTDVMGLQFLRRRKSAFIDRAGGDARDISDHLVSYKCSRKRRLGA